MKNAFTSAELALLRTRPHSVEWGVAIHKPEFITTLTAETVETHPVSALNVTDVTGGIGLIEEGMTAWISDTATVSSNIGSVRIRRPLSGSVMYIMESGSGLINWNNMTHIHVMEQFLPWSKHPKGFPSENASANWLIDYDEAYTNQLERYPPYVNMGPPIVLVGDGAQVANLVGDNSLYWDDNLSNFTWTMPDGQTITSKIGTDADPLEMTFTTASPTGRYVKLEVEALFGASAVGRRLIFKFDKWEDIKRVNVAEITGSLDTGIYEATLEVTDYSRPWGSWGLGAGGGRGGGDPLTEIIDRAEIIVFENANYKNTNQEIGGNFTGAQNIVFRGWAMEEQLQIGPFASRAMVKARSLGGMLEKTASHDVMMANWVDGASIWIEASMLCLDRVAMHVMKNRSTISEIADFNPLSGLGLSPISFQSLPAGNLWMQLRTNYIQKGVLGHFGTDMQGNIWATDDAQISGGSPTNVLTIEAQDRMNDMVVIKDTSEPNSMTTLIGIQYGGDPGGGSDIALGAQSPGKVQGYWGQRVEISQGLQAPSQDTMATWAGNYRAKMNSLYKSIVVPLAGNYRLDPTPQCLVNMSLSANENARNISWSNKRFIPYRITLTYDGSIGWVTPTIEMREYTSGLGGSALTFPTLSTLPPRDPPTLPEIPEIPPDTAGSGFGTAYVLGSDSLYRTQDLSAGAPAWTRIGPTGQTGQTWDFILDPYAPDDTGYLSATCGIFKSTDLNATVPTWTKIFSRSEALTITNTKSNANYDEVVYGFTLVKGSINQQNYLAVFGQVQEIGLTNSGGLGCWITEDGGTTWTGSSRIGTRPGFTSRFYGAADVVPHLVNGNIKLYAAIHSQGGAHRMYDSTDKGLTWTLLVQGADGEPPPYDPDTGQRSRAMTLHTPYHNNSSGSTLYVGFFSNTDTPESGWVMRSTDGGTNWENCFAGDARGEYGTIVARTGIETYTQDSNQVAVWTRRDSSLYVSNNGGSAGGWTLKNTTGLVGRPHAAGGFPFNSAQYYVLTTSGLYVSTDGGDNFTDKTGDLPSGALSAMEMGQGVIVPNWLE